MADIHFGVDKIVLARMVQSSSGKLVAADPELAQVIPPDAVMTLELGCSTCTTEVL